MSTNITAITMATTMAQWIPRRHWLTCVNEFLFGASFQVKSSR